MAVLLEMCEVTVQSVNDHGIKADGAWLNISKFAPERDILLPSVGERVVVHLDKAGYVRKVEAVPPPATSAPASVSVPTFHDVVEGPPSSVQDDRGILATRLATLAAAVAITTSGGGATTDEDVMILAERLERWATR